MDSLSLIILQISSSALPGMDFNSTLPQTATTYICLIISSSIWLDHVPIAKDIQSFIMAHV